MNRRDLIKKTSVLFATSTLGIQATAAEHPDRKRKLLLTVAHITDVHLPEDNEEVSGRYKKCLEEIKKHKVDFFLNGGDSIMDASYDNVTRSKMLGQWDTWDKCMASLQSYDVYSCIGNHDPWWASPAKDDEMYGKDYVVKRLKIPGRYYSFTREGWHFIILDGNNKDVSLDEEQYNWLANDLEKLPANMPVLLMSHFPVFGATPLLVGGNHSDRKKLKDLFYKHRDKVKIMLSGHNHLFDKTYYNEVWYCCNGAMSGFWWGKGDKESAGPYYYLETPPGYAVLKLYSDGGVENEYIPHQH